jgi:glycosyltransferase involved in cell wall biosynthesis
MKAPDLLGSAPKDKHLRPVKLSVCHIISGDLWAGAACQVSNLLSELVLMEGIHVSTITFNEGRLTKELKRLEVPVTCLPEESLSPIGIILGICRHIRHFEVDVVHCHGHKEHILGCLAIVLARRPAKMVRTLHGMPEPYFGLAGLRAKAFSRLQEFFFSHFTQTVIAVSQDMEKRLQRKTWAKKLVCIHNGVNLEMVKADIPAQMMRQQMNIEEEKFIIGTACRLVPIKRLDILIDAFHQIHDKHPHTVLIIAGDGPLLPRLKQKTEFLEMQSHIRFLGHRDDIYNIISMFDLFVMTSEHEGIPITLLEALSLGVPVIVPAVGGIPEILEGRRAAQYPPLSIEHLVDQVCMVIQKKISPSVEVPKEKLFPFSAKITATKTANLYETL